MGLGVAAVVATCPTGGVPAGGGDPEHRVIAVVSTLIVGDDVETIAEMAKEHHEQEEHAGKRKPAPRREYRRGSRATEPDPKMQHGRKVGDRRRDFKESDIWCREALPPQAAGAQAVRSRAA